MKINKELNELCSCGKGYIVLSQNGEKCCSETLRKFEAKYGYKYGEKI